MVLFMAFAMGVGMEGNVDTGFVLSIVNMGFLGAYGDGRRLYFFITFLYLAIVTVLLSFFLLAFCLSVIRVNKTVCTFEIM